MNWLERIYTSDDPTGIFVLAFVIAVPMWLAALYLRLLLRLAVQLFRAALQGRRERLARERAERDARRRIAANLIAAQARRARMGARS